MPGLFLNPIYRDQLGISYEVEDGLAGTERTEGFKEVGTTVSPCAILSWKYPILSP